jgi:hypothetical protein
MSRKIGGIAGRRGFLFLHRLATGIRLSCSAGRIITEKGLKVAYEENK